MNFVVEFCSVERLYEFTCRPTTSHHIASHTSRSLARSLISEWITSLISSYIGAREELNGCQERSFGRKLERRIKHSSALKCYMWGVLINPMKSFCCCSGGGAGLVQWSVRNQSQFKLIENEFQVPEWLIDWLIERKRTLLIYWSASNYVLLHWFWFPVLLQIDFRNKIFLCISVSPFRSFLLFIWYRNWNLICVARYGEYITGIFYYTLHQLWSAIKYTHQSI